MILSNDGMRIEPLMGVNSYKTYSLISPVKTHFTVESCDTVECANLANGWRTLIDESTPLGEQQAYYIRKMSGRRFFEQRTPEGGTLFTFPPGQQCFTQHKVRNDTPEFAVVRSGDWRGNPDNQRTVHTKIEFWTEDFAEHQQMLADRLNQG